MINHICLILNDKLRIYLSIYLSVYLSLSLSLSLSISRLISVILIMKSSQAWLYNLYVIEI